MAGCLAMARVSPCFSSVVTLRAYVVQQIACPPLPSCGLGLLRRHNKCGTTNRRPPPPPPPSAPAPAGLWSVEHAEALLSIALRCVQQSPSLRPLLAEEIVPRLGFLADEAQQIGSDQPEVGTARCNPRAVITDGP